MFYSLAQSQFINREYNELQLIISLMENKIK